MLDMNMIEKAPIDELPFRLITGVTFLECNSDGFPSEDEYKALYILSEELKGMIDVFTDASLVGTFTYQCERLDYYYVSDTTQLRNRLVQFYSSNYPKYDQYISIVFDPEWNTYIKFLYPNETLKEYMSNQKVIMNLQSSGDDLSKARKVNHFVYFPDVLSRNEFIEQVSKRGYGIEDLDKVKDEDYPFVVQISRIDFVDLTSISKVTIELKKISETLQGLYDGWETTVVNP